MSSRDVDLYELETKISENVADLDKRLALLEQKLDIIASNHLEHIKEDIDRLQAILYTAIGGIIVNLIGVIFLLIKS